MNLDMGSEMQGMLVVEGEFMQIYWMAIALISAVLTYILQIILHEFGHMVGGLLTGWQLIHLQVYRFVLVRERKLKFKLVSCVGFQCIMYPKSELQKSNLYTLGGVLTNLLLTMMGLIWIVIFLNHPFMVISSISLIASGFAMLITNGIPNTKTVCNDMSCYLLLRQDDRTRYYHNAQLMIAKKLSEGETYCMMSQKLFTIEKEAKNDILSYQALLEYFYHLDKDEYGSARAALTKARHGNNISGGVEKLINLELLYLDLLMDILSNDNNAMRKVAYEEGIENYIKMNTTRGDIHSVRVMGLWNIYKYYSVGILAEALEYMERIKDSMRSMRYLYQGEATFCIDQMTRIQNILWRDLSTVEKATD